MFTNADTIAESPPSNIDVCIIGAGIAGLVLARKLNESGLSVWIFESGGIDLNSRLQSLNDGRSNLSDYPFQRSRVRIFGGTSTTWSGACIKLDQADFTSRPWLLNSGWPITYADIEPYYQLSRDDFNINHDHTFETKLQGTQFHSVGLTAKAVAFSSPLNLGQRHKSLIANSKNLHCCLNATAIEVFPNPSGNSVERVKFCTSSSRKFDISARAIILACGGIENARLLLMSNSIHKNGLGNSHDVVGRYHMEHPIRSVGILPISENMKHARLFTDRHSSNAVQYQGTFGLSSYVRSREKLLDLHIRAYRYNQLEGTEPIILGKNITSSILNLNGSYSKLGRSIFKIFRPSAFSYLTWHIKNKIFSASQFDHIRLMAFAEQEPDPENRITLSEDRDCHGYPLPHLAYRESNFMKNSISRSMHFMGDILSASGFGKLLYGDGDISHLSVYNQYGLHQMGSTRMSDGPRFGVVNEDCRVHGFSNLYIAGSSVFPTAGAANPTWTIAALSLRLADHLKNSIRHTL